jgi:hypothetical protein
VSPSAGLPDFSWYNIPKREKFAKLHQPQRQTDHVFGQFILLLGDFFLKKRPTFKKVPFTQLKIFGQLKKSSLFGFDLFSSEKKIFKIIGHSFGR